MGNYKTYKLFCACVDENGNVEEASLRELGTLEDIAEAPLIKRVNEKVEYYKKVSEEFSKLSVKYANELNETRIQLKEIQEENKELKSDGEKLRNRIIEINKEYDEDVAAYEAEMEDLYLQIDNLDKENNLLKEQAKDHEICYRDLENNWNSVYEQNQRLEDENEELKDQLEWVKANPRSYNIVKERDEYKEKAEYYKRVSDGFSADYVKVCNEYNEFKKKVEAIEKARDRYRILYGQYDDLFRCTEEMTLDLDEIIKEIEKVVSGEFLLRHANVVRIKKHLTKRENVIEAWYAEMQRLRNYWDVQMNTCCGNKESE